MVIEPLSYRLVHLNLALGEQLDSHLEDREYTQSEKEIAPIE